MANQIHKERRVSSYAAITHGDRILLSKLNHGPAEGHWNLVGGGIQHGEDPLHAVVREIKEEAGLAVDLATPKLLAVLSEHVTHQVRNSKHAPERNGQLEDFHLIGIIYAVRFDQKPECKSDGDGDSSDGCRWFSIEKLRATFCDTQPPPGDKAVDSYGEEKFVTFIAQTLALLA